LRFQILLVLGVVLRSYLLNMVVWVWRGLELLLNVIWLVNSLKTPVLITMMIWLWEAKLRHIQITPPLG